MCSVQHAGQDLIQIQIPIHLSSLVPSLTFGHLIRSKDLHKSFNPGSTHFRLQIEFQSTNGCGLSQSGFGEGGGVHTGGESGLNPG